MTKNPSAAIFKAGTCHKTQETFAHVQAHLEAREDLPLGIIRVVEARKVAARPVQVGREQGENVEITSGLSGGESVVLRPPSGLKDGAQVRVVGS